MMKSGPQRGETWVTVAQYYYLGGRLERALEFCQKAIALDSRLITAHILKGDILECVPRSTLLLTFSDSDDGAGAMAAFKAAYTIYKHYWTATYYLDSLIKHDSLTALSLGPEIAKALFGQNTVRSNTLMGKIYSVDAKHHPAATKYFEKALAMDSNSISACIGLALISSPNKALVM